MTWANTYLPPIVKRLHNLTTPPGAVNFIASDVALMGYLCGFETEITGKTSPWCPVLTESEFKQHEHAQDIQYYYGAVPGAAKNGTFMLPPLEAVLDASRMDGIRITPRAMAASSRRLR
jgi:acid phosphatase